MKAEPIETLIDEYLLGTISPRDKMALEQRMANDPAVAEMVRDSQKAFNVIRHAQNQQLKEKLRGLDQEDLQRQNLVPGKRIMALLFLAAILLGAYMAFVYFSASAMARRNFEAYNPPPAILNDSLHAAWSLAEKAFQTAAYEEAIHRYQALIVKAGPQEDFVARWNILLAQLALSGATPAWKLNLETFIREAPEPLASRAKKLAKNFDSGLHRMFYMHFQKNLSSLKPRLM
jgi:hypothetical protein